MAILCAVMGHAPSTKRHRNQGLDFGLCHHCGCDLIRFADSAEWTQVPEGFQVVWREFGRPGDAGSVATRMARMAPPRRRAPRNARPAPRRDPRGRPLTGAAAMFGTLTSLGKLVTGEEPVDAADGGRDYVICLPGARN